MILKRIVIRNFRSYYGEKTFVLSDRLTLIVGDNGDGKTTFFEALEWLFDTSVENKNMSNISAKRMSELTIGESDKVSVSIVFDHNGEKEIEKQFVFSKMLDNSISTSDFKFLGYEESGSERIMVSGRTLLETCFDATIRRYCMFKGESELNVFDNETALKTLVDKFSNIREIDKYLQLAEYFESESDAVAKRELKNNKKIEQKAKVLEGDKKKNDGEIQRIKSEISEANEDIESYESQVKKLEANQDKFDLYQKIKDRLANLQRKIEDMRRKAECDYNTNLLDKYWILRLFPSVLDEYIQKANQLSLKKRELEKEDIERKAKEKGKQEMAESLINGVAPLPWDVPNASAMREMIDDHVCKVCGREAPEGSDAYNFMVKKLNDYLAQLNKKARLDTSEEIPLFPNHYIDELHTMSNRLSGWTQKEIIDIKKKIAEELEFVQARKRDLDKLKNELRETEGERDKLLIQAQGLSEEMLDKGYKDFRGYSDRKNKAEKNLIRLEQELKNAMKEKERIDYEYSQIAPHEGSGAIYNRSHLALSLIMRAFSNAKDNNVTEFLDDLENQTNDYFRRLNQDDFRGRICIVRRGDSASIKLFSSNGSIISNPGGAQKTTMYMSVLFAISNITTLKREQDYPLIFDAPTSSFGEFKEGGFYNVVDNLDKQCIIVTKDLLIVDKERNKVMLDTKRLENMTCSVYQISKTPGFDPENITTISTTIKHVK